MIKIPLKTKLKADLLCFLHEVTGTKHRELIGKLSVLYYVYNQTTLSKEERKELAQELGIKVKSLNFNIWNSNIVSIRNRKIIFSDKFDMLMKSKILIEDDN